MLTILMKDLRQRARDSTLIVFALVLPLGMAFILNAVLGGSGANFTARYAVVDADSTAPAGFAKQVLEPMSKSGAVTLRQVAGAAEGRALTVRGEVDATFVIPAGFSAGALAGRPVTLEIIGNVGRPIAVQVAREVAESYATSLRSVQLAVSVVAPDGGTQTAALTESASSLPTPVKLSEDGSLVRRQLDTTTFFAAGMAMFFLFFAVVFSVTSIFDERQAGTLTRMLAAPISRPAIVAGKLSSGILVGVASMTILIVVSTLVFGARWGDPLAVAALTVSAVLGATGLMAALATFARTAEQAANWQSVVAMVLGVFGGVFFPVPQVGALAVLGYATPHRWFIQGLSDLAGGGSLEVVVLPVAALLGFAVLGGSIALFRVGRMLQA